MDLIQMYGIFETEELAELCAGRIRRGVGGVRRMTIRRLSGSRTNPGSRVHFTMLPANLSMANYATDVLYAEISPDSIPEPVRRQSTELLVLCEADARRQVSSLLHAGGAVQVKG